MITKRVEESLVLRLITIGERLKRRRDLISQSLGISTQQWLVMLHLAHDPNLVEPVRSPGGHGNSSSGTTVSRPYGSSQPLLASELADALNVSRPNITNMINSLLEKRLIEQVSDANDKRRKRLILSEQGQKLLNNLQPHREELNSMLLEKFSEADRETFLRYAETCLATLAEQLPADESQLI